MFVAAQVNDAQVRGQPEQEAQFLQPEIDLPQMRFGRLAIGRVDQLFQYGTVNAVFWMRSPSVNFCARGILSTVGTSQSRN